MPEFKDEGTMDAKPWQIACLGVTLFFTMLFMFFLLVVAWPGKRDDGNGATWTDIDKVLHGNNDARLLILVLIAGAIGSLIYGSTAFSVKVANRSFRKSWMWWYILRFPAGMGFALLLFLVIRGGLFAGNFSDENAAADSVNPFGIVALAALTGMFAEQASDKLREIFEGIFRTQEKRGFAAAIPAVDSVPPVMLGTSGDALKIVIAGRDLIPGSTSATINGEKRDFEVKDAKSGVLTLRESDAAKPGELKLRVINPENQGGASQEVKIKVVAPVPEVVAPTAPVPVGATGNQLRLTLTASNVATGAKWTIGAADREAELSGDKTYVLTLKPEDVRTTGTLNATVTNPATVGGEKFAFQILVG
ncbi:MAG: hypothetical protein AB7S80_08545 [Rhizobiaceae bacterium]